MQTSDITLSVLGFLLPLLILGLGFWEMHAFDREERRRNERLCREVFHGRR